MRGVYLIDVSDIDPSDEFLLSQMSKKRLEKISRLKKEESKKQSIGAELLLNHAISIAAPELKRPAGWDTAENGKLFIPNSSIYVNLSHSGKYAVCAVSDKPVGIDIQLCTKPDMRLAERFFSADEIDYLKNGGDFFEIWVKKESFLKAIGTGLRTPLKSFSVLSNIKYSGAEYGFTMYPAPEKNYRLCSCGML